MKRFLKDAVFITLLVLVGYGLFTTNKSDGIDDVSEFDESIQAGEIIEDGYTKDPNQIQDEEGNNSSRLVTVVGEGIIKVVDFGFGLVRKATDRVFN